MNGLKIEVSANEKDTLRFFEYHDRQATSNTPISDTADKVFEAGLDKLLGKKK